MPIKPFRFIPTNLREWSKFFDDTAVTPDDLSVDTAKIANNAVTYAKIQNATNERLLGRGVGAPGAVQEISLAGGLEFASASLLRSALSGDVTAPAGSGATTIANAAVTYAKIQNVLTGTLLGRTTVGAGSVEEITPSAPLSISAGALSIDLTAYAGKSTGTYTGAFTGTTTDPAPVIRYTVSGQVVMLYIPATTATSNATSFTITGAPAGIRPIRSQVVLCRLTDNGTVSIGTATMDSSGVLTLGLGVTGAVFTNTGTKAISLQTLGYSLD